MAQARYIVADGVEVTSAEDRDFYEGIFGADLRVLDVGSKFAYEITSNTTITVADGVLVCEGGRLQITNGSIDTFTIPTGTANVTSYFIIGYKVYADGTPTEQFVRKMANATATIDRASIRGGSNEQFLSMYRVVQEGINIISVTPLFVTAPNIISVYPVGSQLMTTQNVNPSTYLGGTWTRVSTWETLSVSGAVIGDPTSDPTGKIYMRMHTKAQIQSLFNSKYGFTPTLVGTQGSDTYTDLGIMYSNGQWEARNSTVYGGFHNTSNEDAFYALVSEAGRQRIDFTYITHRSVYTWRRTA